MKFSINKSLGTNNIYSELDFNDLIKVKSKDEAIKKYGNPKYTEDFIMDDAQGEFRIELNNFFSLEQCIAENININESTWSDSQGSLITVWYQQKNTEYIFIHRTHLKFWVSFHEKGLILDCSHTTNLNPLFYP